MSNLDSQYEERPPLGIGDLDRRLQKLMALIPGSSEHDNLSESLRENFACGYGKLDVMRASISLKQSKLDLESAEIEVLQQRFNLLETTFHNLTDPNQYPTPAAI